MIQFASRTFWKLSVDRLRRLSTAKIVSGENPICIAFDLLSAQHSRVGKIVIIESAICALFLRTLSHCTLQTNAACSGCNSRLRGAKGECTRCHRRATVGLASGRHFRNDTLSAGSDCAVLLIFARGALCYVYLLARGASASVLHHCPGADAAPRVRSMT